MKVVIVPLNGDYLEWESRINSVFRRIEEEGGTVLEVVFREKYAAVLYREAVKASQSISFK